MTKEVFKKFMNQVEKKLMTFTTLFITGIVVSNVIASKVVKIGLFVFPASIISYTFTFIISNMVSESVDKKYSKQLIYMGFLAQITASLLIILGLFMPSANTERGEAYKIILGMNWRFTIASLSAYGTSQLINHYVFNKGLFKSPLTANLVSVGIAQFFDTLVFTYVAFLGVYKGLWGMILSQYVIKVIIVIVTNPVFLLIKKTK